MFTLVIRNQDERNNLTSHKLHNNKSIAIGT